MINIEIIEKFNNDKNVLELKKKYKKMSFGNILGISRNEMVHSSFLKWLFDDKNNFDLGTKPLEEFLKILKLKHNNIEIKKVRSENPNGKKNKSGRIDIYIEYNSEGTKDAIILENKVESRENKTTDGIYQTDKYYKYYESERKKNGIVYYYVFLKPVFAMDNKEPHNKKFVCISYNDIAEIINQLLLDGNISSQSKEILENYLNLLKMPNVDKINHFRMVDKDLEEKELLNNIKHTFSGFDKELKNNINSELVKDFLNDYYNRTIIASIWLDVLKSRIKNITFSELGFEPGTILYLAKTSDSDEPIKNKKVIVVDNKNLVKYNGKSMTWSDAVNILTGDKYNFKNFRGASWFVYKTKEKEFINVLRYSRIKKEK